MHDIYDNKIRFIKFNPQAEKDNHLLPGLVHCYQMVFGEEPWNEWKKCRICGNKWGINKKEQLEALNFMHCGQFIEDFWPSDVVGKDIFNEIVSKASCWLALDDLKVVGFCWGYPITPICLEVKVELFGLADQIKDRFGDIELVGYQDEIGVIKEYRKHNIGKKMFSLRCADFLRLGIDLGVARTMSSPPSVAYLWLNKLGYKTIAKYNDKDKREILARTIKDLKV